MSSPPDPVDQQVAEFYNLLDSRNQERIQRRESPLIPIPPEHIVRIALSRGHSIEEAIGSLVTETKDFELYKKVEHCYLSSVQA